MTIIQVCEVCDTTTEYPHGGKVGWDPFGEFAVPISALNICTFCADEIQATRAALDTFKEAAELAILQRTGPMPPPPVIRRIPYGPRTNRVCDCASRRDQDLSMAEQRAPCPIHSSVPLRQQKRR